jgi:hypothetical protein
LENLKGRDLRDLENNIETGVEEIECEGVN